ncbi:MULTISPECIES: hypothetical protein [unclassified Streptomyces]|uniref:hypothetical protein n=1 Tax=unclassified Streptomyces TaxID=2593676 RepID=UPI0006FA9FBB|nr:MULTISPECIES: hypothetical protein [unclassified Streptomyces]KQX50814.1 hypothetical protein ASD33_12320 [Streptomyces sp. Root1304]KRA84979.1 hypothetical protein ASE09_12325 [Streptomyces sp. Root66D1]
MMASQAARPEPDRPRTCFVVGPIGDPYAAHGSPEREAYEHHLGVYEQVIAPACAKYDIEAVRADGIPQAGDINAQICSHVIESDLVIADVSGGNPNVMYELGLRHITGKPTIHIGEAGQLPFDIASIRTIRYQRSRSRLADARKEIESALEAGLRDGFELLTPARVLRGIQEGDGPSSVPGEKGEGPGADDESRWDDDSPGLLDDFAAIEEGLDEMVADMEAMTRTIETIGALTERSNVEMSGLTQASAPASARLAAVARFAEALGAPAAELNTVAGGFAERMPTLDSGVRAALGFIETAPAEERDEGTTEFLEQLMSLDEAAQEGLAQMGLLGASAGEMVRFSRHFRKPAKDISAAVKRTASAIACMGEWAGKARALAAHGATL